MAASFNNLFKFPLRSFLISPVHCRQILMTRIQSCTTKPKEQSKETKQEKEQCFGINYLKDGTDPPLLPDNEYPDWLWRLTEPKIKATEESSEQSITYWKKLNKKRRRQENEIRKQKKL